MLLVEDSEMERNALVAELESARCHVYATPDPSFAISKVVALKPDVVLMDLGLPEIDGWEAIGLIRERMRTAANDHSPWIIAYSGFEDADARRRAFAAGCNEYVTKREGVFGALRAFAMRHKRS